MDDLPTPKAGGQGPWFRRVAWPDDSRPGLHFTAEPLADASVETHDWVEITDLRLPKDHPQRQIKFPVHRFIIRIDALPSVRIVAHSTNGTLTPRFRGVDGLTLPELNAVITAWRDGWRIARGGRPQRVTARTAPGIRLTVQRAVRAFVEREGDAARLTHEAIFNDIGAHLGYTNVGSFSNMLAKMRKLDYPWPDAYL
jgi:hypothetical protein